MGKQKKKDKVIYIDDGRTIADMSGVTGGTRLSKKNPYRPRAGFKEQWDTYWGAVKMVFTPMLVVICGLLIIYMLLSFIFLIL